MGGLRLARRACWLAITGVVIGAAGVGAPARACEPIGMFPFTITPSSTDQVPPTLAPIPAPMIHRADGSSEGGCIGPKCGDVGSVAFAATGTDDVTARPGYRITLAAGALPANYALPSFPIAANGDFVVLYGATGDDAFDYTLQVVAVDSAGNESAPQMVRVHDDPGGCTIARLRPTPGGIVGVAAAALLLVFRRRARR